MTRRWSVARERSSCPPPLPLAPGPVANGEYVPGEPTTHDRDLLRAIRATVDDAARRSGLDRRQFLQGAGGVAAALAVFNLAACGGGSTAARRPGGRFRVPPSSDVAACEHALASPSGFVFDAHTHHVIPSDPWRENAPDTVQLVLGMLPPAAPAPIRSSA